MPNESPTKLRAELLAFLEEKDRRKLVPLIGTRVIDCGYQPPRADEREIICECGEQKKPDYETCYSCHQNELEDG